MKKILIAHASRIERTHLEGLIRQSGFETDVCGTASEASLLSDTNDYAAAFLDSGLKGIDKLEKALNGDVRIIMLGDANYPMSLEEPVLPEKLRESLEALSDDAFEEIEGLDRKTGIANCGSLDGYLAALNIFYNTIDVKADEIERYYDEKDIKNYTIKVHALKSSAKLVGALSLSELAFSLEKAGNTKDTAFIDANTKELLSMYRAFKPLLKPVSDDDADDTDDKREYMDDGDYKDTINAISEFAEVMDYDSVEMMLDTFKEFRLKNEDAERVKKINALLFEMKWEEIKELCRI